MREQLWTEAYDKMLSIVGEDNFDAGTDMSASEIKILSTMKDTYAATATADAQSQPAGVCVPLSFTRHQTIRSCPTYRRR